MKKLMNKVNEKLVQLQIRSKSLLADRSGASFVEFALYAAIVVFIAAVVLKGLDTLFNGTIFPNITNKINEFTS